MLLRVCHPYAPIETAQKMPLQASIFLLVLRGYYFNTETKLYFLKTRYYDPVTGRFITIDDISYIDPETINGLNLYAYCGNNPVMAVDPNGNKWWRWLLGGLLLLGGVILCCIPGGQAIGASLIVGGASITLSNIMSAAGVDGKTASLISSGLDIVSGIALCFVPGLQGLGASLIGSGVLGIAGGYISESLGGRFELGAAIGNIIGGFIGGKVYQGIQGFISTKTASKSVTEVGNYLLRDSSGTVRYTGVGSRTRMMTSLREKSKIISGLTAEFRVAPNRTMAFAREAMYLNEFGGARSMNQVSLLLNKINSPGLKYLFMWF